MIISFYALLWRLLALPVSAAATQFSRMCATRIQPLLLLLSIRLPCAVFRLPWHFHIFVVVIIIIMVIVVCAMLFSYVYSYHRLRLATVSLQYKYTRIYKITIHRMREIFIQKNSKKYHQRCLHMFLPPSLPPTVQNTSDNNSNNQVTTCTCAH